MVEQPNRQTLMLGSKATFSVLATKAPGFTTNGIAYQWQINPIQLNGDLYWTNIPGATNSTLEISNAQLSDVGYYRAIAEAGGARNASDPVSLILGKPGSLLVFGTPVVRAGSGWCSSYAGYVMYESFAPINPALPASAQDVQSTSTKLEADGSFGDAYCYGSGTVSIPPPIPSPCYSITIYFARAPVPTGTYACHLDDNFRFCP